MEKVGIIGRTTKNLNDGQTILTRMFKEEFENQIGDKIYLVDTYNYKKKFLICLFKTFKCLCTCDIIFIMLSRNGLSFYLPFLYYCNKIFKKKIYHRVIGGNLDKLVVKNKKWKKYLNSIECNYVETKIIANNLKKQGVQNVKISPNFKRIIPLSQNTIEQNIKEKFNFCTFSRVVTEKGISDAIKAINYLNINKTIAALDIYGPIDELYKDEFNDLLSKSKNIRYMGIIDSEKSVDVLKNYYMLLFPTYWEGEGFPGTLIDCFASGLPVIATDWNSNSEIIKNNVTGIIYIKDDKNVNLTKSIQYAIRHIDEVNKMRSKCLLEYEKYTPKEVVGKIVEDLKLNL